VQSRKADCGLRKCCVYAECVRISQETGVEHHVDHIVPLRGRIVHGLRVHYNLQILPGTENIRKGNRV
jgi:hypothetical protein